MKRWLAEHWRVTSRSWIGRAVLAGLMWGALPSAAPADAQGPDPFLSSRQAMVDQQIRRRGVDAPGVLQVMENVPRHLFVPEQERSHAYEDVPIVIGDEQTLSQAYLSAQMIALLDLQGDEKVLEVGTGSGYDAALLSRLAGEVWTMEIDPKLASTARKTLSGLGYDNVHVLTGDGYRGWPEAAPYDAILVTAAPQRIPEPLRDQLAIGGRMVVAVGGFVQDLQVLTKTVEGWERRKISPVVLGPMTGEVEEPE